MKPALGQKKRRRIERLTGRPVHSAFVRGGWPHFWAQVFWEDGTMGWVNYRTGEMRETLSGASSARRRNGVSGLTGGKA